MAPLAAASVAFGVSFGILARAAGFDATPTIVVSAVAFSGSAQFAAVATYAKGGGVLAAVAVAASVNTRYAAMGLSAGRSFRGSALARLAEGQFVVDESWGVAIGPDGRLDIGRLVGAGILLYVGWTLGTAVGAVGARFLPPPHMLGLDAAFPALFLALVIPRVDTARARIVAIAAGALTLALSPVLPQGLPVLLGGAVCLVGGWRD